VKAGIIRGVAHGVELTGATPKVSGDVGQIQHSVFGRDQTNLRQQTYETTTPATCRPNGLISPAVGRAFAVTRATTGEALTLGGARRPGVGAKGEHHKTYAIHGDGIDSIRAGFDKLAMSAERRNEAIKIIREVLDANHVRVFRWYKTPGTNELSCYWDDADVNMLWVTPGDVHIEASTSRPARSPNWQKQNGKYIGWLLPGANAGTGGGVKEAEVATVLCPETFLHIPVGSVCPTCEIVHQ
jgi:hypothetical protein